MKNKMKVMLLLSLLLFTVGCSRNDYGYYEDIEYSEDEPRVENGTYIYPNQEVLYKYLEGDVFYEKKTDLPDMYLVSIGGEDGLIAEFVERTSDGVNRIKYFRLTPKTKKEIVDRGAYYLGNGSTGIRNVYSKISFDTTDGIMVMDEPSFKYVVEGYIIQINSIETVVGPEIDANMGGI